MIGADEAGFITLARVTKTQGRKGEVAAALSTDFPERFASRKQLFGLDSKGQRHELKLEDHWPHKGQIVLKFAGIDSISQAETLIGWEIQLPRSQRVQLEEGQVYISDLKGCTVHDRGRVIGKVEDVLFGSGEAPLLVVRDDVGQEHLVPFAASYIEEIALEQKQVRMKLPDGLLELDSSFKKDAAPKSKADAKSRQL
ncbi:MAG TPA: ribosome maturation factor RimM [Candidatus Angelobacter sp.]|jgi:16S rRNA processing protein RimM|nr:ribosome maturation factor RimM [Candidatus Angelobacter sp.]